MLLYCFSNHKTGSNSLPINRKPLLSRKKLYYPVASNPTDRITYFPENLINSIDLPERFTFPFYYEPHELTKIAAEELQHYLETQTELDHNFGLNENQEGIVIGKMFGVLVVKDTKGKLGYLS